MDLYKTMKTANKVGGCLLVLAVLLSLATPLYATGTQLTGAKSIASAMQNLCESARLVLGVGSMLLVVLAAVVYAVGQIVGAETRARASVWATAMVTGAIIGIIIYILVPYVISAIIGGTQGSNPCNFAMPA